MSEAKKDTSSKPVRGAAKATANKAKRKKPFFMPQKMMLRVVYALVPIAITGIYFFGWRVLAILALCNALGLATETIMARKRGQPVSMAVFVTAWLYALSLPPTIPFWIAGVGIVVAILFGKEVFGGFGRNFANPAIVGRAFVYVSFPIEMTGSFVPAFKGWPGGFAHWSFTSLNKLPEHVAVAGKNVVDAVTSASPMLALRDFGYETSLRDLFHGTIGTTFQGDYGTQILAAGSIGEGCALLIILAGAYLFYTRTANWRLTASTVVGAAAITFLLRGLGAEGVQPFAFKALAGAFLYVAVFMVTDPISAPKKKGAMYVYGALIGILIILLSWKSQFVAAASFAVLLGNIVSPLLDMGARQWAKYRREHKKKTESEKKLSQPANAKDSAEEKAKPPEIQKGKTAQNDDGGSSK